MAWDALLVMRISDAREYRNEDEGLLKSKFPYSLPLELGTTPRVDAQTEQSPDSVRTVLTRLKCVRRDRLAL